MASPPHLMPELIVDEILVRFPPDDPACLMRASLVCKPWRSLLCDPAFRRRFVAFHRAPPLLGFIHTLHAGIRRVPRPRFVSTIKPSPLPLQSFLYDGCGWHCRVLDCRHGRVLFHAPNRLRRKLVVLEPASGNQTFLPETPMRQWTMDFLAAVLCAAHGCDHRDCAGAPFLVVLVCFNVELGALLLQSHLYSSEARTWSSSACLGLGFRTVRKPSVLIGDDVYFLLVCPSLAVLKVNMEENHLSMIDPPETQHDIKWKKVVLMAMEDGSLGFAAILGSIFCVWSRNVISSDVVGGWARCRVIELQTLFPFKHRLLRLVGFAEGSSIIFIGSDVGVFSLDLKTCHERKVDFYEPMEYEHFSIFPFTSFYTPDGANSKLRLPLGPR